MKKRKRGNIGGNRWHADFLPPSRSTIVRFADSDRFFLFFICLSLFNEREDGKKGKEGIPLLLNPFQRSFLESFWKTFLIGGELKCFYVSSVCVSRNRQKWFYFLFFFFFSICKSYYNKKSMLEQQSLEELARQFEATSLSWNSDMEGGGRGRCGKLGGLISKIRRGESNWKLYAWQLLSPVGIGPRFDRCTLERSW